MKNKGTSRDKDEINMIDIALPCDNLEHGKSAASLNRESQSAASAAQNSALLVDKNCPCHAKRGRKYHVRTGSPLKHTANKPNTGPF